MKNIVVKLNSVMVWRLERNKIYGSNNIEAEYKLPGYLIKSKRNGVLQINHHANLIKIRDKDPKKIFEILRDEIDYDDDGYEYNKRHIYKTLDLKRFMKI